MFIDVLILLFVVMPLSILSLSRKPSITWFMEGCSQWCHICCMQSLNTLFYLIPISQLVHAHTDTSLSMWYLHTQPRLYPCGLWFSPLPPKNSICGSKCDYYMLGMKLPFNFGKVFAWLFPGRFCLFFWLRFLVLDILCWWFWLQFLHV